MAGFDVVTNHIGLILFSIGLDLLLWLGPQVHLVKVFEPLFIQASELPDMQSTGTLDLLRQGASQFNLVGILRAFPVGVPSMMTARAPSDTPLMLNPILIELSTFWQALGLWVLLVLAGIGFGTLFFTMVSQAAIFDRLDLRQALTEWPRNFGHVILLTVFWYVMIAILLLPLSCLLSILLLSGIGTSQLPLLIALFMGGLVIWLLIPLFFSPHGIFVDRSPMWVSVTSGVRLSRMTFTTTGLLILSIVLLSEGLDILWNRPAEDSWLMLVGIAGHAFVTTALLAATFVYYRQGNLWLKELVEQRKALQA